MLFNGSQVGELASFISLMNKFIGEKTFVHCAANYRTSVFTGLYMFTKGSLNEDEMLEFIESIWQPDPVWRLFIEESLEWIKARLGG